MTSTDNSAPDEEGSPFEISVFSKAFEWQAYVNEPIRVTLMPRWRGVGYAEIVVDPADPAAEFLLAKGARVTVEYLDEPTISGRVRRRSGDVATNGELTFYVSDYSRLFSSTLAWVAPDTGSYTSGKLTPEDLNDAAQAWVDMAPGGTDRGYGYYVVPQSNGEQIYDSAESIIKHLIAINMRRLGRPVTIAPSLNRGGNARAAGMIPQARMTPLDELLADLLEWSGLGLRAWHVPGESTIRIDVVEPTVWEQKLTPESGIVVDGDWTDVDPEATRVVVGGPGELAARAFLGVNDTTGLEDTYGEADEVFRDATGARMDWGTTVGDLQVAKYFLLRPEVSEAAKAEFLSALNVAGGKALTEGRPTVGLNVTLSETETFHYGGAEGFHLGDTVTIVIAGQEFTDQISQVSISWDSSDGLVVVPRVGNFEDDPDVEVAEAITSLANAVRRLASSR